jgi:hypothetical protein
LLTTSSCKRARVNEQRSSKLADRSVSDNVRRGDAPPITAALRRLCVIPSIAAAAAAIIVASPRITPRRLQHVHGSHDIERAAAAATLVRHPANVVVRGAPPSLIRVQVAKVIVAAAAAACRARIAHAIEVNVKLPDCAAARATMLLRLSLLPLPLPVVSAAAAIAAARW